MVGNVYAMNLEKNEQGRLFLVKNEYNRIWG